MLAPHITHSAHLSSRPVLPPPEARNMAQRVIAAHDAWREAHDTARRFDGRCAANGTGLFLNLSIFIHELVHDEDLCKRLVQHFEKELRADFPPAQGKML